MTDFCKPTMDESIGRIIFIWNDYALKIITDRITDAGIAELWFYHRNGKDDSLLHTAKANLLSTSTMSTIAKRMVTHSAELPWQQILTYIAAQTMEYQRRGDPGVVIEPTDGQAVHPGYFVSPFVMRGVPNIIYGEKGVNKTTFCLALLGIIALGDYRNALNLTCLSEAKVAILDWEGTRELTEYTLSRMIKGESISWFQLPYLHCRQTLADDIQRIANFLHEKQASVVLIDSLGQAAGSDRYDSAGKGAALHFFEVLRQLKVTSLIIGQTAKNEEGKKTIYGSTYFTYYARNIFQLRGKVDELDENKMHIALSHEESNYSKRYPPQGFCLNYTDDTIKMEPEEVSLSQFYERASQTKNIMELLQRGTQSRQAIANELDIKLPQVDVLLNRLKKRKKITALGSGMWGILEET